MKILFLFLDGIGLGEDNPANPLLRAHTPHLESLLGGKKMTKSAAPFEGDAITLKAVDPNLGVKGLPQSATGQAVLLTGVNIPAELGYHYGPKPNPEVAQYLNGHTIFSRTVNAGKKAALLDAYPTRYFDGIDSGKRPRPFARTMSLAASDCTAPRGSTRLYGNLAAAAVSSAARLPSGVSVRLTAPSGVMAWRRVLEGGQPTPAGDVAQRLLRSRLY